MNIHRKTTEDKIKNDDRHKMWPTYRNPHTLGLEEIWGLLDISMCRKIYK
jgi:hypothetical protein